MVDDSYFSLSSPYRCIVSAVLLGLMAVFAGCGTTSHLDTQTAGKTTAYRPGVPNFDMELIPTEKEERPGVNLHVGIPYRSLIFVRQEDVYTAEYELITQIYDGDGEHILETREWTDSLVVSTYEQTNTHDLYTIDQRIDLGAGEYVFRVMVRDRNSDQQTARHKRLSVPSYGASEPFLGHLYLERVEFGTAEPIVTLHVPSDLDSLRAVTELYNGHDFDEIEVSMHIVRFQTDHGVASPPHWFTPFKGSLERRGVDYNRVDTIHTVRYTLENLSRRAQLEFMLPTLERGVYRVGIQARSNAGDSETEPHTLNQTRDLSVKGSDFPTIAELDEVIDALAYIADERELSRMKTIDRLETKRHRFDAFWGKLAGDQETAARLLRTYYSRVEDANLFFTSHKEGWKTDRGMMYIVMGPPLYVEHYFDAEVWHYSYSRDPQKQFVFERVRSYRRHEGVRFNNYFLQRRSYYQRTWDRALREWRRGTVM